jgi:hypothetical protein
MSGSYVVLIHYPGKPPEPREFGQSRVVVGREAGAIILADSACSSTHAEVLFDGHTVRVRDLGSTNGTWMNGQRSRDRLGEGTSTSARIMMLQSSRAGPARGRTVAVNAAPGPERHRRCRGPVLAQIPATRRRPPCRRGPAPAYGAHARPRTIILYRTPPRSGGRGQKGSSAAWVILGLLFAGTVGVGLIVAIAGRKGGTANASGTGAAVMKEAREATVKFVWFTGKEGRPRGWSVARRVRVGPNSSRSFSRDSGRVRGRKWGSVARLPGRAFNASRAVGGSLVDYDFNVHVGGLTDVLGRHAHDGQHDRPDAGRHAPRATPP